MSDRLAALRLFIRVARTGSFSRAGREFRLSQPSASRMIAGLEAEVGAMLFARTTRAVTLTEAGAEYLARIEPLLLQLEEADHAARGTGEIRGLLRVGLSSSFAVREVIPRLPAFLACHTALRIDLLMNRPAPGFAQRRGRRGFALRSIVRHQRDGAKNRHRSAAAGRRARLSRQSWNANQACGPRRSLDHPRSCGDWIRAPGHFTATIMSSRPGSKDG